MPEMRIEVTDRDRVRWLRERIVGKRFRCKGCGNVIIPAAWDRYEPWSGVKQADRALFAPGGTWADYQRTLKELEQVGVWCLDDQTHVHGIACVFSRCPVCARWQAFTIPPRGPWEWLRWGFSLGGVAIR